MYTFTFKGFTIVAKQTWKQNPIGSIHGWGIEKGK